MTTPSIPPDPPADPKAGLLKAQLTAAKERIFQSPNEQQDGFLLLSSPHEAMPKLGFLDPVLEPMEKVVWANIWIHAKEQGGNMTGFPSHRTLMVRCNAPHSRVISRAIQVLRLCRWITLCERVHDPATGRIKGHLYVLHDEPVPLSLTQEFDDTYMEFLQQCTRHTDARLRDIAERALAVIDKELAAGVDPLVHDPMRDYERRMEAGLAISTLETALAKEGAAPSPPSPNGDKSDSYFGIQTRPPQVQRAESEAPKQKARHQVQDPHLVKHQVQNPHMVFSDKTKQKTPGAKSAHGVFGGNGQKTPGAEFTPGVSQCSSSYINKTTTTTTYTSENENKTDHAEELIKPAELSGNEYRLILQRIARYPLEDQQNLLDEIGEQIKMRKDTTNPVRNPVGYLNWLCQKIDQGDQPLSSAYLNRQQRRKRQAARETAEREAAQRAMQELEELKRKATAAKAKEVGNG